uniref:FMRFamide-related neuropeptides-like n=1 Tax=Parastrongyloides trichosuri TaxID=131310 RepID=A0A0N4Z513_PARTI
MHSYNQTVITLRFLLCMIALVGVISGNEYGGLSEVDGIEFPTTIKRYRPSGARELFGKRSADIDSKTYFFGRQNRRGRELFGKRSGLETDFWSLPDDQNIKGFYAKRTRARELLGKRSGMSYENLKSSNNIYGNEKRRARELLGKRSYSQPIEGNLEYFEPTEDFILLKPQYEDILEVKRGRTRELFGR